MHQSHHCTTAMSDRNMIKELEHCFYSSDTSNGFMLYPRFTSFATELQILRHL
jgi:hypothetical protein